MTDLIVCWHNGHPMHARSARILRNQLAVIEEGNRVALWEAVQQLSTAQTGRSRQ